MLEKVQLGEYRVNKKREWTYFYDPETDIVWQGEKLYGKLSDRPYAKCNRSFLPKHIKEALAKYEQETKVVTLLEVTAPFAPDAPIWCEPDFKQVNMALESIVDDWNIEAYGNGEPVATIYVKRLRVPLDWKFSDVPDHVGF